MNPLNALTQTNVNKLFKQKPENIGTSQKNITITKSIGTPSKKPLTNDRNPCQKKIPLKHVLTKKP